jgi:hypothetical protein
VPDLPVLAVDVAEVGGVMVVRIVQALDAGRTLTLTERTGGVAFDDGAGTDGRSVASVLRGPVSVGALAPVPLDSLRALLDRIR